MGGGPVWVLETDREAGGPETPTRSSQRPSVGRADTSWPFPAADALFPALRWGSWGPCPACESVRECV